MASSAFSNAFDNRKGSFCHFSDCKITAYFSNTQLFSPLFAFSWGKIEVKKRKSVLTPPFGHNHKGYPRCGLSGAQASCSHARSSGWSSGERRSSTIEW